MYAEPQLYQYDQPRAMVPLGTLLITSGALLYRTYNADGSHQTKVISENSLRNAALGLRMDTGWLPASMRLLRWGMAGASHYTLVFCPPHSETIFIIQGTDAPAQYFVPLPGIVFASVNRSYLAWAVKPGAGGDYDLTPTTPLYHVPLPNLDQNGVVCWGPNPVTDGTPVSMTTAWQTFLHSPFNSSQIYNRCKTHSNDVRRLWVDLAEARATVFPTDELMPHLHLPTLASLFTSQMIQPIQASQTADPAAQLNVRDYDPLELDDEADHDFDL